MADKPKDISVENIVSTTVEMIYNEAKRDIEDWASFWDECWTQIIDESDHYGLFFADNSLPGFPTQITGTEDPITEIKKQLTQIANERLGFEPKGE